MKAVSLLAEGEVQRVLGARELWFRVVQGPSKQRS